MNRNIGRFCRVFIILFFSFLILITNNTKAYADNNKIVQNYAAAIENWRNSNINDVSNANIEIPAVNYIYKSNDANITVGSLADKSNVLMWNNNKGQVEYSFVAPEAGLYNISIEYYVTDNVQESVERGILIGGKTPFAESNDFLFERGFKYDEYPFKKDAQGDDIHSKLIEVKNWSVMTLTDRQSSYTEPFKFFFSKGENRLTLTGIKGVVAISKIIIKSPEMIQSYSEYRKSLSEGNAKLKFSSTIEAENLDLQSGTNIQVLNISQPGVTPQVVGKDVFNTLGGQNWENAHDWVEWEFSVPKDGIYNMALKYQQNFNSGLNSYREVEIDGKVPFKELLSVSFPFGSSWQLKVLGDKTPYDFYLTQGEHKIRLTVTNAPYANVKEQLRQVVNNLRDLDLQVQEIIGSNNEDVYRSWNLEQYIPGLKNSLSTYSKTIEEQVDEICSITENKRSLYSELTSAAADLREFASNPDLITKRTDSLSSVYTSITDWTTKLDSQPIVMDNLTIKSKDENFPSIKVNFINRIIYFVKDFLASFINDHNNSYKGNNKTIQVWVQRNMDYVNLMQEYANEYFTPKTGIKVKVNYCAPGANMLVLANAAGKQPDVATGVDAYTTYSFAERGALVNLDNYPGYNDLKNNVASGSLVPYHYMGGDYGLPEEVICSVLYYRQDALQKYNMEVPQTWDDVIKDIPTLEEHNDNFFYPYGDYQTFFAQNNIDTYTKDGLNLAFTTPQGYKAFQFWTDLYIKYGMPEQTTNFYQHFRLGDTPIGIAGIDQYVMFELSAPDISGLWSIAQAPGTKAQDGTIQRYEAGNQNGVMMFKTNKERQEMAWQYLQWWLSTDTQTQFANDLGNYLGPEFLWYSANPNVIKQQNRWDDNVKDVLIGQLQWYKPIPYVPGGSYMTPRELWNAWTRVVIDKKNCREQLQLAAEDIETEMKVKQQEFGFVDSKGNVQKTLDILPVCSPTKGR